MRIKHWIKNILILFPLVFSGNLLNQALYFKISIGVFVFCVASSIIYIFNDLQDIERDKQHPLKRKRPFPSGEVSLKMGWILIGCLCFILIYTLLWADLPFVYTALYILLNIIYSLGGKNIPLLDVSILASGYLIRLLWGGYLCGTGVSEWMFLTVLASSFYLGFGKRKNELKKYGNNGRAILKEYGTEFLDKSYQLFGTLPIALFSVTCMDNTTTVAQILKTKTAVDMFIIGMGGAEFTIPLVILICLRYNLILDSPNNSGDPVEVVFNDRILIGMIMLYIICIISVLYL